MESISAVAPFPLGGKYPTVQQSNHTKSNTVHLRSIIALAVLLACGSCASDEHTGRREQLVITGASTIAPLAAEIAKRFERLHPGTRVDVQSGGSSRGIADVRRGLADIGMVSRELKADELDLRATTIARDGVCIIVHRDNPVAELSDEQIRSIYLGQIENWKDVGGVDAKIIVVNKAEGRSTLELFLSHFGLQNRDIRADVVIGENEQGIKTVSGNPDAIGYVSIGTAQYDASENVAIKLLPLGGVAASIETVLSGSFPLARPLNLVTTPEPSAPLVEAFLRFAASPEVHDLVREQYFVPLAP
jgi:phosphate transport system substrate-binding protein